MKFWTAEEDAILRRLVGEGLSAAKISRRFDALGLRAVSRNAVIGRAERLNCRLMGQSTRAKGDHGGWGRKPAKPAAPAKRKAQPKRPAAAPKMPPPAAPARLPALAPLPPPSDGILLVDCETGHCRWPLWPNGTVPPTERQFVCGVLAATGSWCATHRAIAVPRGSQSEIEERA